MLCLEPDMTVVAEAVAGAREHRPDVALDIEMPVRNGIDATRELRAAAPGTRVLILTTVGRPGYPRPP